MPSFFKQFKKDLKNKKEHKKAFLFLFLFLLCFLFFYIFFALIFDTYIIYFFGFVSSALLNLFKISNVFYFDAINKISIITISAITEPLLISFLCSGIIEFCLLSSAIFASKGISYKKMILGFLLSIPLIVFFNIFRIVLTAFVIVHFNLGFAEFLHGFLFRLFLILIVVGFYYFWFMYFYRRER